MLCTYLIGEAVLKAIEAGANAILRSLGGPDHVPNSNEDFVWF